jgi:hypothetical protein
MQQHVRIHVWAKLLLIQQNSWLQRYFLPGVQKRWSLIADEVTLHASIGPALTCETRLHPSPPLAHAHKSQASHLSLFVIGHLPIHM